MHKRILALLLVLAMTALLPIAALADNNRLPDYSRTGSIAVTLLTSGDKRPVPGGSLQLFAVAVAKSDDGNNFFEYTAPFASCGQNLDNLESQSAAMAAALAEWVQTKGVTGTAAAINANGHASFSGLKLGLYLIVQDETVKGFEPVRPFLVTLPVWDSVRGELVYDVTADPKCDSVIIQAPFTPAVIKVVERKSGTLPAATKFHFQMTPGSRDYPMPEGTGLPVDAATGTLTLEGTNAGTFAFGTMFFGLDDVGKTFTYRFSEVPETVPGFEYDKNAYILSIQVDRVGDEITLKPGITKMDGSPAGSITFTNVYNPKNPPKLPQTGMYWWPVPVLLAVGILLMAFGFLRNRSLRFED